MADVAGSLVGFEAWAALAGDSPTSRTEWAAVVGAWSEPHRRYHDLAHLAAVLGLVGRAGRRRRRPRRRPAGRLVPRRRLRPAAHRQRGGQRRAGPGRAARPGARRAGRRGRAAGAADRRARPRAPDDANGAVLCDADLAVLASPPEAYAAYASAVREEYGHLSDEEFTAGRIAVLEHLLALPRALPDARRRPSSGPPRARGQPDRRADAAQAPRGFRTRSPAASSRLSSSRAPDRLARRPRRRSS